MLKHWKYAVRALIVLILLIAVIYKVNNILTPKFYINDRWPSSSTYEGFYSMEKDTVDVLMFGSSHAMSCLNPQAMYNECGIKSYNLGSVEQSLVLTYWWLVEALKTQSPKVVVIDAYMLFVKNESELLNTEEVKVRRAVDAMHWSDVKWGLVQDVCRYDPDQTVSSYIFPNERYHTRWTELSENDFEYRVMNQQSELKGFTPIAERDTGADSSFEPFSDKSGTKQGTESGTKQENELSGFEEMAPLMQEYMDKIVTLCRENDIKVVLIKTPNTGWTIDRYYSVMDYAGKNGIEYLDFDLDTIYEKLDFDFHRDMYDIVHCNIWGAEKVSKYLANYLAENYGLHETSPDSQWEVTKEYYSRMYEDCGIKHIYDISEYVDAIKKPRYTIFISTKKYTSVEFDEDNANIIRGLGISLNSAWYDSYIAVINQDCNGDLNDIMEMSDSKILTYKGSVRNRRTAFSILADGNNSGGKEVSIMINNEEQTKGRSGLNIVVYNSETDRIVDAVSFDGKIIR